MIVFTVITLLAISFLGLLLAQILKPRASSLEHISLSYLLGLGLLTFTLFVSNFLGLPYSGTNVALIYLGLTIVAVTINFNLKLFSVAALTNSLNHLLKTYHSLSRGEKVCMWLLVFIMVWVVLFSSYWPVKDWDSIVLYDFRAHMFLGQGFMDTSIPESYLYGYPLLTSLAHMLVYITGHQYPGIMHALFYVSFVMLFYVFVRSKISRSKALFWTLLFSLSSNLIGHAYMTYTNLAYVVYLVLGLLYLFEWVDQKNKSDLVLSGLLIGLSTWARSAEPFWVLPIIVVVIVSLKNRDWWPVLWFPVFVKLFGYVWQLYKNRQNAIISVLQPPSLTPTVVAPVDYSQVLSLSHLLTVLQYYITNSVVPDWDLYLCLVLICTILYFSYKKKEKIKSIHLIILSVILTCVAVSMGGVFIFSFTYSEWQNIGSSLTRMMLFLGPLTFYLSTLVVSEVFEHNKNVIRYLRRK